MCVCVGCYKLRASIARVRDGTAIAVRNVRTVARLLVSSQHHYKYFLCSVESFLHWRRMQMLRTTYSTSDAANAKTTPCDARAPAPKLAAVHAGGVHSKCPNEHGRVTASFSSEKVVSWADGSKVSPFWETLDCCGRCMLHRPSEASTASHCDPLLGSTVWRGRCIAEALQIAHVALHACSCTHRKVKPVLFKKSPIVDS